MNHEEATAMAVRIAQIWPRGGIATDIWVEELKRLHLHQANAALRKLKHTLERPPSLATFYAEYNSGSTVIAGEPCERCDAGGWVEVTDDRRHALRCAHRGLYGAPDDCQCHAVEPCTCVNGQARQRTATKVAGGPITHTTAA